MRHLSHCLRTHLRRFWPDLLIFLSASIWATLEAGRRLATGQPLGFSLFWDPSPEICAWIWLTLRLMLADNLLLTTGGWRARPLPGAALAASRWLLYGGAVALALGLRTWQDADICDLQLGGWCQYLAAPCGMLLLNISLLALMTASIGSLISGRKSLWVLLGCLGLGIGLTCLWMVGRPAREIRRTSGGGGESGLMEPIKLNIPSGDRGMSFPSFTGQRTGIEPAILQRYPMPAAGESLRMGEFLVKVLSVSAGKEVVRLRLRLLAPRDSFGILQDRIIPLLRFADGHWSSIVKSSGLAGACGLPGCHFAWLDLTAELTSPSVYPWVMESPADLLAKAELVLAASGYQDWLNLSSASRAARQGDSANKIPIPPLSENPSHSDITKVATAAARNLQLQLTRGGASHAYATLEALGPKAVPAVLAQAPFARPYPGEDSKPGAWDFLAKHARPEDLPALLGLLEADPRAAGPLFAKGWQAQAMPLLLRHLEAGRELPQAVLRLLVALRDPGLTPALASQIHGHHPDLAPLLWDSPGLDRQAYVREGLHRGPAANWLPLARDFGEREHLRAMVRDWLNQPAAAAAREVSAWISPAAWNGPEGGFSGWIRENFDKLRWNPAEKRWGL